MNDFSQAELRDFRYHKAILEMQGHVFYCQDEDGVLRRWHPPQPIELDSDKKGG